MLLIPAIDLKDGVCVRLRQGLMEDATIFSTDIVATAEHWLKQGARRLHMVDLNGAFAGKPVNAQAVEAVAKAFPELPIQIGGGIRNFDIMETYLSAGVAYLIIGTKAAKEPEFVEEAAKKYPGKIIVGIDAKGGQVAIDGWAKVLDLSAVDLAKRFKDAGVEAIIYTDIGRDGMMQGVNIEETTHLAQASQMPIIASGGITNMDDIHALAQAKDAGIIGAITGRAIYEGTLDFRQAQNYWDKLEKKA